MSGPPRDRRGRTAVALSVVAALAAAVPANAQAHRRPPARLLDATPVTAVGCEEHEAWVDGDAATIAARLPSGYTPVTDPSGEPLVFARAEHCRALTIDGRTRAATLADWGVVVDSPDGQGCASGVPQVGTVKGDVPPVCNWYPLSLVSDDRRLVGWLREATPTIPAAYVRHLTYRDGQPDALGRFPFHFRAPRPSPFTIDDVSSLRPGVISLRGGYWFAVRHGTAKMIVSTDDLTTGPADTVVRAAPGSALARLMGARQRASVAPYDEFGVIRVGHGVLRKQLFAPPLPGERLHRFAGSCSAQGEVSFRPPATDTEGATTYTYDARGTCTGRLDGREMSAVPIHLHHAGRAQASCNQGMAFPPGAGAITFPGQVRLPYTLDFTTDATEVYGTLYGTRSGQASGHATFLTQRTSPTVVADCATTGAKQAPLDLSFSTQRTLVSDE